MERLHLPLTSDPFQKLRIPRLNFPVLLEHELDPADEAAFELSCLVVQVGYHRTPAVRYLRLIRSSISVTATAAWWMPMPAA